MCVVDGKSTAYFRGRKLCGQTVRLPEGYRGAVVERHEPKMGKSGQQDEPEPEVIDVDAEDQVDMGTIESKAEFDEFVVWGHETMADAGTDHYVRSVQEWLTLADQVCPPASTCCSLPLALTFIDTF